MSLPDKMKKWPLCVLLVVVVIDQCLSINRYVMLGSRNHHQRADFVPMLFHDPRFPQRRPQVLFVPVDRRPKQQQKELSEDEPSDDHPHVDDHHHYHHHYHHDHFTDDGEEH